MEPLPAAV